MSKANKLVELQKAHMNDDALNESRAEIHESWFDPTTIDYWRHDRMYQTIAPLANKFKDSTWLTVGDGRFGLDSYRMNKKFGLNMLPTDISENMLKVGKEKGIISDYRVENAEALSFADNSYDLIFCKEALHHLPRPYVGLYEMIRVAAEAVILIEPHDEVTLQFKGSKLDYLKSAVLFMGGKFLKKNNKHHLPSEAHEYYNIHNEFEPAGNYVYGISNREINKVVHSLDLGEMAFLPFNDAYENGVAFQKAEEGNKLFQLIKDRIKESDDTGHFSMCTTVIFKNKIDQSLRKAMKDIGFIFPKRHKNPFLNA